MQAAQESIEPDVRERVNILEKPTPSKPTLTDLGYLTKEMSEILLTWSHQLKRMGKTLVQDKHLTPNTAEYGKVRRLIQNNMDTARYTAAQLNQFSTFVIPLGDASPRYLATTSTVRGPNPGS